MATTKKRGRGRPVTVKWSGAKRVWQRNTNKELSIQLDCSVPAVFNKRKALMAAAEKDGTDPTRFLCTKDAYSRVDPKKAAAAKAAMASNS